jgi:hypothetical protein
MTNTNTNTIQPQQLGAECAIERASQSFGPISYWDALVIGMQRLEGDESAATEFAEGLVDQQMTDSSLVGGN